MSSTVETFIEQIRELLPSGSLSVELEKNMRALAMSSFSKLDLVSREEFDAQSAVLARTREKLEQLEAKLQQLS